MAAAAAAFGAQIDDPIGAGDDVQIVFNHHHRVALIHQLLQDGQQFAHVLEMQSRGGFIQNIQRAAGGAFGEFLGQLDALGFPARQGVGGLSQLDIIQPNILQQFDFIPHGGDGVKERQGFLNTHLQNIGNGFVAVCHIQRFAVVPFAFTRFAFHIHIGQKVHFNFNQPVPLTGLAPSPLDVKGKAARGIAAGFGLWQGRKPIPNGRKGPDIGDGVGPRRASDGGLINFDDFVDPLAALDAVHIALQVRTPKTGQHPLIQTVHNQRRLARPTHPRDTGQGAQRNVHIHILQIVIMHPAQGQGFSIPLAPCCGGGNFLIAP